MFGAAKFIVRKRFPSGGGSPRWIWDGGSVVDSNWMTDENWIDDVAPPPGASVIFTGNVRTTPVNNYPNGTVFNITFDAAAAAFTMTGNSITTSSIANHSGNVQTIQMNLTGNPNIALDVSGADINIESVIS